MPKFQLDERKVKMYMAARGIDSLEELARMSNVTSTTFRRLFAGSSWKSNTIEDIARALNCNPLDILRVEGYPAPHMGAPAIATI